VHVDSEQTNKPGHGYNSLTCYSKRARV